MAISSGDLSFSGATGSGSSHLGSYAASVAMAAKHMIHSPTITARHTRTDLARGPCD
jgi:hypothetical protein